MADLRGAARASHRRHCVRLRGRLSAPRAERHAGVGMRQARADGGSGIDGHADGRPHDVPEAPVGTPVVLWGEDLPVDEVAAAASTVGYELLCAVAPRVPFVARMSGASTWSFRNAMAIVVTGAAGFIGSNLVKALNARGETPDSCRRQPRQRGDKFRTSPIATSPITSTRTEFLARIDGGDFDDDIDPVLHQGACSDTMETDGRYMMRNNYRYSVSLLEFCQDNDMPFCMRRARRCTAARRFARAANTRRRSTSTATRSSSSTSMCGACCPIAPRRSPASATSTSTDRASAQGGHGRRWHSTCSSNIGRGKVHLFEGSGGYAAGEQRRDFISVDDVVKVNLEFMDHPGRCGIFNVGTGRAATFNAVAMTTSTRAAPRMASPRRRWRRWCAAGAIAYMPFPPALDGKYQSFTEADLARLRGGGLSPPMLAVEEGVRRYVEADFARQVRPVT